MRRNVPPNDRDAWTRGYAAGIAAMLRVSHDYSAARKAMVSDGVTVDDMEGPAEEFDLMEIRRAVSQ